MRKVALLAILGILGVMPAFGQATTTTTQGSAPVSFTTFDSCTSENVTFTGSVQFVTTVTINKNRLALSLEANYQDVTGTGLTTGDTYHAPGTSHETFTSTSAMSFPAEFSFEEHVGLVSNGPAPNEMLATTIHLTVNADGTTTADVTDMSIECQ